MKKVAAAVALVSVVALLALCDGGPVVHRGFPDQSYMARFGTATPDAMFSRRIPSGMSVDEASRVEPRPDRVQFLMLPNGNVVQRLAYAIPSRGDYEVYVLYRDVHVSNLEFDNAYLPSMTLVTEVEARRRLGEQAAAARGVVAVSQAGRTTAAVPRPLQADKRPGLSIGAKTIWLDSTSMADVGVALGAEKIDDVMDVHERLLRACYMAGAGPEQLSIHIVASADVPESLPRARAMAMIRVWNAVVVRGDNSFDSPAYPVKCVPLSVPSSEIRWWNGMRVGMPLSALEGLLGPPHETYSDGRKEYSYSKVEHGRVLVAYGIEVRADDGIVTRIDVRYVDDRGTASRAKGARGHGGHQ